MQDRKNFYIETFGCQMNFSDSEIVASILKDDEYTYTIDKKDADVILINTCSVRDNAELRVHKRLLELKSLKKKNNRLIIGIIGCMAERLKEQLLEQEKIVDLIAGPDAYRKLPELINSIKYQVSSIKNLDLPDSEETYEDIAPFRYQNNRISAFISIMRGCENFCSYCVVPYTRGKERSREPESIINEAKDLFDKGYKEVTLLGQNVNSYNYSRELGVGSREYMDFTSLLREVAHISPLLRVRFATSHPKDISDALLRTIADNKNICRAIHLPLQSGSSRILKMMNRKYTREAYMERISAIKKIIPDCAVSTDIITGFCTEAEEDHQDTLSLLEWAGYDYAYMFKYSERPGTLASAKYKDDIPDEVKTKRLNEIIKLQQKLSYASNKKDMGIVTEVLAEGVSKRSAEYLKGRNSQNKVVIFPASKFKAGDYVNVRITKFTSATLFGEAEQ